MDEKLSAIIEYSMTPDETAAFKIALLWERMSRETFPDYKHAALRKRGDPRKSNLFRVCWTLHQRFKGVLAPEEYKYYILAQLSIFKELNREHGDLMITPQCLLGDKAWIRWKVWKRRLDQACKNLMSEQLSIVMSEDKLRTELGRSRLFLMQRFEGVWTKEKLLAHVTDMLRWVASSKVSVYYLALSPWCREIPQDRISIDLSMYRKHLTPESSRVFAEVFPEETGADWHG